tara:strand:- start:45759 stop:46289 length:531 start_codon:yes stop_codon:yes gene_type:complete
MDILSVLDSISYAVTSEGKFNNINSGGCAYFALFVKHHLDFIGVDNEFVYIDDRDSDTPEEIIDRIMHNWHRGSAAHVGLRIGDKYFDSNGVYDDINQWQYEYSTENIVPFNMSVADYYEHAIVNKRHDWSSWYEYKKNNESLQTIINLNFESWYKQRNLEVTEIKRVQKELQSLK